MGSALFGDLEKPEASQQSCFQWETTVRGSDSERANAVNIPLGRIFVDNGHGLGIQRMAKERNIIQQL